MTTGITLSSETVEILKNFSAINSGILLTKGNIIRTISVAGSIFSEAEIAETFPQEFGVGDLPQFIQVLSLPIMQNAGLNFVDKYVDIVNGDGVRIRYYKKDKNCIAFVEKTIPFDDVDLDFALTSSQLTDFMKAAAVLKSEQAIIEASGGQLSMVAQTSRSDTSNSYKLDLGDVACDDLAVEFDIKSFIILYDNFKVSVKSGFGLELVSTDRELRYVIGASEI